MTTYNISSFYESYQTSLISRIYCEHVTAFFHIYNQLLNLTYIVIDFLITIFLKQHRLISILKDASRLRFYREAKILQSTNILVIKIGKIEFCCK